MKTRSIDNEASPEVQAAVDSDGNFDMSKLPKQKPVDMAAVSRMLNAPQVAVQKEVEIENSDKNDIDLTPVQSSGLGADWIRQDLPSLCLPYAFKDVFFKTITIPVLAKIHAAKENASLTLLIDALNNCCSVDLRDLTPSDFTFAMYWLRDNSLPRSPMKLTYTTKYNNQIEISTRQSNMKIKELDMSKEEVAEWKAKGIVFPTLRDAELITRNAEIDEEMRYLLDYAQYVEYTPGVDAKGNKITDFSDYVDRKIARLSELGLDIIEEIDKFATLITHGVDETVVVQDPKFEPLAAADFFEEQARKITTTLNQIPQDDVAASAPAILALAEQSYELLMEAKSLRERVEAGEEVLADKENVAVSINATDFFPRS